MTTSRLSTPGGGTQSGALQLGRASASKTPRKGRKSAYSGGRRKSWGGGSQAEPAAGPSALTEIREFASSLKGGWVEAGRLLGVSEALIRRACSGSYGATPHRLLEAWARYRAANPQQPSVYLVRVVRLGRVLVAGRYFSAPDLERLNGNQVVLRPDGEHRFFVYAGAPLQLVCLAVTWAEAQALLPANPGHSAHDTDHTDQGENT